MVRTCPGRLYMMMNLPERGTVSWSLMTFQVSGTCTRGKQTIRRMRSAVRLPCPSPTGIGCRGS